MAYASTRRGRKGWGRAAWTAKSGEGRVSRMRQLAPSGRVPIEAARLQVAIICTVWGPFTIVSRKQPKQRRVKTHARAQKDRRLKRHINQLGLESEKGYRAWCLEHGLSKELHKTPFLQQKEQELARKLLGQANLTNRRRGTRHPRNTIDLLYRGELEKQDLGADYLKKIQALFAKTDEQTRSAMRDLLVHVDRYGALFDMAPAIPYLGQLPSNTFVEAMGSLARYRAAWIRPVEEWRPKGHNPRRQFNCLARHLLARYDVPFFMDAAWFQDEESVALQQQNWFAHIANGGNIRTADIPVKLTKKMAHSFSSAPEELPIELALRWGQVAGQGGGESLARAVMGSRLGTTFENEEFWETVIKFLVNNPMVDPTLVGPIIDFIHNVKYEPREIVQPGGAVEMADPLQPNFAVKARSVDKLLTQMEAWHAGLGGEFAGDDRDRNGLVRWGPSGLRTLRVREENPQTGEKTMWMVQELLSTKELSAEGRAMRHCVSSYAKNCRKGNASIWSLQAVDGDQKRRPVMTIAVDVNRKSVTQVRGKYNIAPVGKVKNMNQRSLNRAYLRLLERSQRIFQRWVVQEGLSVRC